MRIERPGYSHDNLVKLINGVASTLLPPGGVDSLLHRPCDGFVPYTGPDFNLPNSLSPGQTMRG